MLNKAKLKAKETRREVMLQTITLVNAAFALVAALAWNEAIKALLDRYFKAGPALFSKFVYAIFITVLVVLVSRYVVTLTKRLHSQESGQEPAQ